MTKKDAETLLDTQKRIVSCLRLEIDGASDSYDALALSIEKACGGRRMSEEALLAIKSNADAPAKAQQESIQLGVVARDLAKRRSIVGRKEQLCATLALFISEDDGVMRKDYTTAYYNMLKSKTGGLTHKEKADKFIFGLADAPAAAQAPPPAAAAAAAAAPILYAAGGGAASSAAKTKREEDESPPAASKVVRLTASGQPDKRTKSFKDGAK
jgi:hypothetical protein